MPPLITSAASANLFELAALSVIWLLWLVGCVVSTVRTPISRLSNACLSMPSISFSVPPGIAAAQSIWPNLSFCYRFEPCRILSAMMAFAWLGWIVLVVLIVLAVLNAVQKARPARSPLVVEWAGTNSFAQSEYVRSEYGGSSVRSNMREVV